MGIYLRWTIRRDMSEILAIENSVFDYAWTEDDFIRVMRERNCIGMVAEIDERVVGYMIYELHRTKLHVLNFAVARPHWRQGVGRTMVAKLIGKLDARRRRRLMLEVRETNVPAQLFFHRLGFLATAVLRDFYRETDGDPPEDAYLMEYDLKRQPVIEERKGNELLDAPC